MRRSADDGQCILPGIGRATGTGLITSYVVQPQNVSRFRTAGADLNLDYVVRTSSAGTFDLRLVGGYLDRAEFINTPGAAVEDDVDQVGRPKWQADFSPISPPGRFFYVGARYALDRDGPEEGVTPGRAARSSV